MPPKRPSTRARETTRWRPAMCGSHSSRIAWRPHSAMRTPPTRCATCARPRPSRRSTTRSRCSSAASWTRRTRSSPASTPRAVTSFARRSRCGGTSARTPRRSSPSHSEIPNTRRRAGRCCGSRGVPGASRHSCTTVARPWQWLALRNSLVWRKQATRSDLDFVGDTASLAIEDDRGPDHIVIRYDLDYDVLGGQRYLFANRGTLGYRRDYDGWDLGASYSFRARDFQRATEERFDGDVHTAEVTSTVHVSPALDVDGKLFGWRETTQDPLFTSWTFGAQLGLRVRPRDRVRLAASLGSWYGTYDGPAPNGDVRRDSHADANGELELDLADNVLAVAALPATINRSPIEDFDYWQLVARVGVAFAIGGP